MKIILSRKGFDSGAGGYPSPILPSGRLCSLPIPDRRSTVQYRDIAFSDSSLPAGMSPNLGSLVSQLTNRRVSPLRRAHLDPDLDDHHLPRQSGWRPIFGQRGAALGHLQKQDVGAGDLFLFFGWFKQTELFRRRLRYVKDAPDLHIIFGWLQVQTLLDLACGDVVPDWAQEHPHVQENFRGAVGKSGNTLYIGADKLAFSGLKASVPGAGIFQTFNSRLQLSKGDTLRSHWSLPTWFMPTPNRPPLTYHSDLSRWEQGANNVLLRTVGRGQEFVLDASAYPESDAWLHAIFDL